MLVHPSQDDSFTNTVDVTAQWVGIDIGQREAGVGTWRVLELPWCYPCQH